MGLRYEDVTIDLDNELHKTIYGMISDDYVERFKAEYYQLKIRQRKLEDIIVGAELGKLNVNVVSLGLLKKQYNYMGKYASILRQRAILENIDLDGVNLD